MAAPEVESLPNELVLPEPPFAIATINCFASGYPQPKVYWMLKENQISEKTVGKSRLSTSKEGIYTCAAESEAGTDFKSILVVSDIGQKKRFPPILPYLKKVLQAGVSTKIKCKPRNEDQFTRYRK